MKHAAESGKLVTAKFIRGAMSPNGELDKSSYRMSSRITATSSENVCQQLTNESADGDWITDSSFISEDTEQYVSIERGHDKQSSFETLSHVRVAVHDDDNGCDNESEETSNEEEDENSGYEEQRKRQPSVFYEDSDQQLTNESESEDSITDPNGNQRETETYSNRATVREKGQDHVEDVSGFILTVDNGNRARYSRGGKKDKDKEYEGAEVKDQSAIQRPSVQQDGFDGMSVAQPSNWTVKRQSSVRLDNLPPMVSDDEETVNLGHMVSDEEEAIIKSQNVSAATRYERRNSPCVILFEEKEPEDKRVSHRSRHSFETTTKVSSSVVQVPSLELEALQQHSGVVYETSKSTAQQAFHVEFLDQNPSERSEVPSYFLDNTQLWESHVKPSRHSRNSIDTGYHRTSTSASLFSFGSRKTHISSVLVSLDSLDRQLTGNVGEWDEAFVKTTEDKSNKVLKKSFSQNILRKLSLRKKVDRQARRSYTSGAKS